MQSEITFHIKWMHASCTRVDDRAARLMGAWPGDLFIYLFIYFFAFHDLHDYICMNQTSGSSKFRVSNCIDRDANPNGAYFTC
jgi:hypothetical protein